VVLLDDDPLGREREDHGPGLNAGYRDAFGDR
jgi:hypothetical protein